MNIILSTDGLFYLLTLVATQIGDNSVRTILEELFRGMIKILIYLLRSFLFILLNRHTCNIISKSFN